ncbi:MAG TPA: secretin N-terminal domain-containing protein [Pirellulales bacterium]|nr:secretin N-terminal domain-containing protein [Pirellulales bacterium]
MPRTEEKPAEDKDKDKKDEKTDEKKDEEKNPEEKKEEPPPVVKRSLETDRPADPRELTNAVPDEEGTISFSFNGQPWPAVLEWMADVSDMSLDWDEAPAGPLNLTTRGRYTPEEVRDLLNSVLLNKGFTVMRNGEVLIVSNLRKLDSSLVPRVSPADLDTRGRYEFVRSFFDLDWLVADQAAEEIKPLLSPYGKVTALKATNRLDVLDTAGNLRRIRDLIVEEQSQTGTQRLVEEFKLRHTRAEEVLDTLNTLLGIETKQAAGIVDPRQLMQAMMMTREGGNQQPLLPAAKKENSVYLAVNARENSILAFAPPDKMGVIRQAIDAVDVPHNGKGFLADAQRVKVYRLSGLQPETLVKVLKELGSLDPTTKLEVDEKKNALVAYAPLADHLLITDLVERLDGTGRKFEVIQLRTLSAEYVAGSIITLMNGPEKQEDNSRRGRYYPFFDSSSQQPENTDKFWVEADIERNRLLLRANDVELAEVRALLTKLGEIPADQRSGVTMRVVPANPSFEMLQALERVQRRWETMSPNPLEVEIEPDATESMRRPSKTDEETPAARRRAPTEQIPGPQRNEPGMGPGQRRQPGGRGNRSTTRSPAPSRFRFAQDRITIQDKDETDEQETDNDRLTAGPAARAGDDSTDDSDAKSEAKEPATPADAPMRDKGGLTAGPTARADQDTSQDVEARETTPDTDPEHLAADAPDADADGAQVEKPEPGAERPADEEMSDDAAKPSRQKIDAGAEVPAADDVAPFEKRRVTEPGMDGAAPFPRRPGFFPGKEGELPPEASELPRRAHAPIHISLGPHGLVISSSDTDALDKLEQMLSDSMPPRSNYEFFTLKHTYAKDMVTLLKDIFKADLAKDSSSRTEVFDMFWNGNRGSSGQQTRATLSRRRPLNFVADPVTNTVLVQGADAGQLAEIEDLIDRYDRAEPPNSESVRRTKQVALRYAKALDVANIVKDVYRDLLSPNDKALLGTQPPPQPGRERSNNDSFFSAMFTYLTDDPTQSEVVPRFKGMLSVAVDERANGVIISAPQILLTDVLELIADVDKQAKPTQAVVRVMRLPRQGTAAQVRQALNASSAANVTVLPSSQPAASLPSSFGRSSAFGTSNRSRQPLQSAD